MTTRLLYVCTLLAASHMITIAAPALQQYVASGTSPHNRAPSSSTVLVAASDEEDGGPERETAGEVPPRNHGNNDDDSVCHSKTPMIIESCLAGFEVQYVVYNASRTEFSRWYALKELCRQHDFTLLCIHRAFLVCPPTSVDRQIIAIRLGYLRDFMAEQCPIVKQQRPPTTTTTTTTSTTTATTTAKELPSTGRTSTVTPVGGKLRQSVHGGFSDFRRPTSKMPKIHLQEFNWASQYSTVAPNVAPISNSIDNLPGRQIEDRKNKDLSIRDIFCESHEGQNSLECLFQPLKSSGISTKPEGCVAFHILSLSLTALWKMCCS